MSHLPPSNFENASWSLRNGFFPSMKGQRNFIENFPENSEIFLVLATTSLTKKLFLFLKEANGNIKLFLKKSFDLSLCP